MTCLWDTGAQFSVITPRIAEILGLDAVYLKKAYTANGIYETPVYRLDAILPTGYRVRGLKVSTGDLAAATMTNFDRGKRDPRDTELRRVQEVAEALSARFPDDETIKESVEAIRKARERRAALPTRPRRINGYR